MKLASLFLVVAVAPLGACGDDGSTGADAAPIDTSTLTYAPCANDRAVGGFAVELGDGFTAVQGQVFDAVNPGKLLQTVQTEGTCSWVRAPQFVCDPACAGGMTCGTGNVCVAQPVAQDVGDVVAFGLKAAVTMPPRAPAYFYSFTGTLPHPGFDPGASLRLTTAGTTTLDLLGWGIEPLAGVPATMTVQSGQAMAVSWTAPTVSPPASDPVRVEITLNVNGHGLVGSHVDCVAPDTGSFTIPEPLVTALLADGLSGFPTATVRRTTTDSADVAAGCVELDVRSQVTIDLTIPGLTSCSGNDDCTPPQTCQADLTCG
ncbi:MAG: hypothetical protein KA297_29900 [Kofleriaceae bacterium]|nr:hypothetical protein [Kofleriaceae bacterium]MBP6839609.1 hypothetical protein [Kofleriaceae bacterium]